MPLDFPPPAVEEPTTAALVLAATTLDANPTEGAGLLRIGDRVALEVRGGQWSAAVDEAAIAFRTYTAGRQAILIFLDEGKIDFQVENTALTIELADAIDLTLLPVTVGVGSTGIELPATIELFQERTAINTGEPVQRQAFNANAIEALVGRGSGESIQLVQLFPDIEFTHILSTRQLDNNSGEGVLGIRRESDGLDLNPTSRNNEIDRLPLIDLLGGSSAFVPLIRNQAGGGDGRQTNANRQFAIARSGSIIEASDGNVALESDGATRRWIDLDRIAAGGGAWSRHDPGRVARREPRRSRRNILSRERQPNRSLRIGG